MPIFKRSRHHHHGVAQETHSSMPRLTARQFAELPKALPCDNYYDMYPEDAGPTGTVVIDCHEEMQMWALVATPVSEKDALQKEGGCIQYITGDPKNPVQYYRFQNSSDGVFGRAAYLQRPACGSVVRSPSS